MVSHNFHFFSHLQTEISQLQIRPFLKIRLRVQPFSKDRFGSESDRNTGIRSRNPPVQRIDIGSRLIPGVTVRRSAHGASALIHGIKTGSGCGCGPGSQWDQRRTWEAAFGSGSKFYFNRNPDLGDNMFMTWTRIWILL